MAQLGGHAIYLTEDVVLGARESVRDVARNLERFVDAIVARTGPHEVVVELAAQADDPGHQRPDPARAPVPGAGRRVHDPRAVRAASTALVVAFVGDGNNVYHSLALLGAALGMEVRLAHPAGYAPNERIVARAEELAAATRRTARVRPRPGRGRSAAPPSSTPTPGRRWARRPRPRSAATRSPRYRVDDALLDAAGPDAVAMHCLPAHRGEEITSDGHGRAAEPDLGPVGEPAARPEGAARRAARGDGATRERQPCTSATRTRCGAATSPRCAAASTRRSPPTARRPRSRPTGRCRTSASAASWPGSASTHEALAAYDAALERAPDRRGRAARPGRRPDRGSATASEAAETLDRLAARPRRERPAGRGLDAARRRPRARRSRAAAREPALPRRLVDAAPQAAAPGRRRRRGSDAGRARSTVPEARLGRPPVGADEPTPPSRHRRHSTRPRPIGRRRGRPLDDRRPRRATREARPRSPPRGHRAAGQLHAAIDACYQALASSPADPDLHLLLAELYSTAAGGRRPPTSSSCSAGSSTSTDDADDARARCATRRGRALPDDPRLDGHLRLTRAARPRAAVRRGRDATLARRCRSSSDRSSNRST